MTAWQSDGAPIVGLALGTDGTVLRLDRRRQLGIRQLDRRARRPRRLKLKDWLRHDSAFTSTPIVFDEDGKTYVAATSGSRLYVLDAGRLAAPIIGLRCSLRRPLQPDVRPPHRYGQTSRRGAIRRARAGF